MTAQPAFAQKRKTGTTPKQVQKTEKQKVVEKSGMITITFDDAHYTQLFTLPFMNQHGFKGVLYVPVEPLAQQYMGYHMTAEGMKLFADLGWQIGSHSYDHEAFPKFTKSKDIEEDMLRAHEQLVWFYNLPITSYAPPYSHLTDSMLAVAKANYRSIRHVWNDNTCSAKGCSNGLNDLLKKQFYDLCSADIGMMGEFKYAGNLNNLLRQAREEKKWLILTFHKFPMNNPEQGGHDFLVSEFKELMKMIADNGLPVVTIDEGIRRIEE